MFYLKKFTGTYRHNKVTIVDTEDNTEETFDLKDVFDAIDRSNNTLKIWGIDYLGDSDFYRLKRYCKSLAYLSVCGHREFVKLVLHREFIKEELQGDTYAIWLTGETTDDYIWFFDERGEIRKYPRGCFIRNDVEIQFYRNNNIESVKLPLPPLDIKRRVLKLYNQRFEKYSRRH